MMSESEIRRIIRQELREAIAPILMGTIVSNADNNRSSIRRFSEGEIPNARNIQPFGISSRAPEGMDCLTVPIAGDPTHLNVAGHFDKSRPSGQDGEVILYDAFGHKISLLSDKVKIDSNKTVVNCANILLGSEGSDEPLVLGNILKDLLSDILDKVIAHTHNGNLGYLTSPPSNAAEFLALKVHPVSDGAIISDKSFTEK